MSMLIILFLFITFSIFIIKYVKRCEYIERLIAIALVFSTLVPLAIYYSDWFNLPSRLGFLDNIDSNRWFNLASDYIITIIGTILSSSVVILTTMHQFQKQTEENNNNNRITNMPLFRYEIMNKYESNKVNSVDITNESSDEIKFYYLNININNVGLNHARNIKYIIYLDDKEKTQNNLINPQSILKNNDDWNLNIVLNLPFYRKNSTNEHKVKIIFYYEDLLSNKYSQELTLNVETTLRFASLFSGYLLDITSIVIKEEKYLK